MNPQKLLLELIDKEIKYAEKRFISATIDHAAMIASKETWISLNPDDGVGGFSSCPYDPKNTGIAKQKAEIYLENLKGAKELLLNYFI